MYRLVLAAFLACVLFQQATCQVNCSDLTCNECFDNYLRCNWCFSTCTDIRLSKCNADLSREFCSDNKLLVNETNVFHVKTTIGSDEFIDFSYTMQEKQNFVHKLLDDNPESALHRPLIYNVTVDNHDCRTIENGHKSCNVRTKISSLSCSDKDLELIQFTNDDFSINKTIELTVPCSECTQQDNSPKCSGSGTLHCNGTCSCNDRWFGQFCDKCHSRGDMEKCEYNTLECSGNGKCKCGSCVCDRNLPFSQFFDSLCTDICEYTRVCVKCKLENSDCDEQCNTVDGKKINFETYEFNEDKKLCHVQYSSSESFSYNTTKYKEEILVFLPDDLNGWYNERRASSVSVYVPAIIGAFLLAALLATLAYLSWNAYNKQDVLSHLQYENIDAEACKGENPLYKSPLSSYKNPTYTTPTPAS